MGDHAIERTTIDLLTKTAGPPQRRTSLMQPCDSPQGVNCTGISHLFVRLLLAAPAYNPFVQIPASRPDDFT